jgi:GxxExxY protein
VRHHRELTERTIGLAIEVHRRTVPGWLQSFYAAALYRELERAGIPAMYKSEPLPLGSRADGLADKTVIPEFKAVPAQLPAYDMQ